MTPLEKTKLGAWLKRQNSSYFHEAEQLRDTVTDWLGYVVHTFPHYTKHTVDHSDNIVRQISHLLFPEKKKKPVVALSPIEAYVLIAAAYLHDAGMVVSDSEKRAILESDDWKRWVEGAARERWEKVRTIREAAQPADPTVRDFLADVYTRHLMAEYVRRVHHKRAARVIADHPATFDRFSLKDPLVARTIADVCVGHGLSHAELQDRNRYPEQRQLAGDHANVRWMAIMLRLGDLLDMRAERACPLLLNAASPLPPESVAHWTQYQKLTQFLVSPERIEIAAECDTRDEYQALRDWCHWIEEEAKNATLLMTRAERHEEWQPPAPSIAIGKSANATFLVDDWRFELDRDAVFDRLIYDVYEEPITFIRELIQNALDATRVRMYLDLEAAGLPRPEYPTEVDQATRDRYPVELTLETRTICNEHTGEDEQRQVFTITDHGVGMDREIISRYLLQIGRSYYISDEFQRSFRFVPTSRFGVGFLSVFAVADQVTIDTYKPTSRANDNSPIQLVLRGVRNYVLPQVGARRIAGTRIEVVLRKAFDADKVSKEIRHWCRRVEFPIQLAMPAETIEIRSEQFSDLESHTPDADEPEATWHIRAYPFQDGGVAGEIYIRSRSRAGVETLGDAHSSYNSAHPVNPLPDPPSLLLCLHGIATRDKNPDSGRWSWRADVRRPTSMTLSRMGRPDATPPEIERAVAKIVNEHVTSCPEATGANAWEYRQRLAGTFGGLGPSIWQTMPMIPAISRTGVIMATLQDLHRVPIIATWADTVPPRSDHQRWAVDDSPTLDLRERILVNWLTESRIPAAAVVEDATVRVQWKHLHDDESNVFRFFGDVFVWLPLASPRIAAVMAHPIFIVNEHHELGRWLSAIREAVDSGKLDNRRALIPLNHLRWGDVDDLEQWRTASVPPELRPPPLVKVARGIFASPPGC